MKQSLREQMKPLINLHYPHFEKHNEIFRTNDSYAFEAMPCPDWYREMVSRILEAIATREFLPLYRMGDGEYTFALGKRREDDLPFWQLSPRQMASRVKKLMTGKAGHHKSGSAEYGWEVYNKEEKTALRGKFINDLRIVAQRGLLCMGLDNGNTYGPFMPAIADWLDEHNIPLNRNNFYHVYHVYVLFHGPDRYKILSGKNVLVITSLSPEKKKSIERGLNIAEATSIQFVEISAHKAMFEQIDLHKIHHPVDLVLIGAGIGSVNILSQLVPLNTACLDVGFVLTTLGNPDARWNRPFCVTDEEFDVGKVKFLPKK
jgi:hypothetical protein